MRTYIFGHPSGRTKCVMAETLGDAVQRLGRQRNAWKLIRIILL